ncbi:hypothetical protein [Nocardia sp. NBC_01009]|uniref:hypothetical protein n=1 Tax=Nocardia sp. NBC_01009 TaxID=2975996 RepID=UPI00386FADAE|nr:hypothetical protein OHA42_19260 [Nocardia sp. NBC_01009]
MRAAGRMLAAIIAGSAIVAACSTTPDPDRASPTVPPDAEVGIAVRIAGGTVTPTNTRTEARVFQLIVLRVDSDTTEELHVHSEPGYTFPVEPRAGQEFRFTVMVPGRVDVELHHAGKTVTTLLIRQ